MSDQKKSKDKSNKLQDEVDQLKLQLAESKQAQLRALADYQNLSKRVEQQRTEIYRLVSVSWLTSLLPVIDDLERAQAHLKDQGLDLVLKRWGELLKTEAVEVVNPINTLFDPSLMECIDQVEGEVDTVVEVVEKGYKLNDFLIRPAKVKVGKKENNN